MEEIYYEQTRQDTRVLIRVGYRNLTRTQRGSAGSSRQLSIKEVCLTAGQLASGIPRYRAEFCT